MKTINHWRQKSKKTSEDGKISYAHWLVESTLWKCQYYQKQSTWSMHSLSKFHRDWKINPKIHKETQKTSNSQSHSEWKSNAGGNIIPGFKLNYRATKIKTPWYWYKNRHEDQCITTEDPDINPRSYSQLIFNKGAQNTRWRKDILLNKCCWENWISTCRRQTRSLFLTLYQNQLKVDQRP
jgi:hypothetical protein